MTPPTYSTFTYLTYLGPAAIAARTRRSSLLFRGESRKMAQLGRCLSVCLPARLLA